MSTTFQTLIVPADISDEDMQALADSMGVTSACRGVPPRLADVLSAEDLPTLYTETADEYTNDAGAACEDREMSLDDSEVASAFASVMAAHDSESR